MDWDGPVSLDDDMQRECDCSQHSIKFNEWALVLAGNLASHVEESFGVHSQKRIPV